MKSGIRFSSPLAALTKSLLQFIDLGIITVGAQISQALMRRLLDSGIDGLAFEFDLLVDLELVDAHHDLLATLDLLLGDVGRVLDLVLDVAAFDGAQRAAHLIDAGDVFVRAGFDFIGQVFDQVRARQRIDRISHARLVRDDLLRAQRHADGFLGRQPQGLVHAVGVQGLRPAQDGGQRLQA